ncbi:MAG TPA: glycerate-2-kinase family protein, partial [Acidobacteriota bacterium]|nr:glycerate-2-kinase family protein [Acidobacteriota bacterium]
MERSGDEHRLKRHAVEIFQAALRAVDPRAAVRTKVRLEEGRLRVEGMELDLASLEQVYVVGAGKASAAMAQPVEAMLGDRITRGVVSVKVDHRVPLEYVAVREASHPVPDDAGCRAAKEILDLVSEAGPKDLVIVLLSGGGSALLPLPVDGVSLEAKQETTRVLLGCGATIHEINAIRKHLSRVKGGRLAAAAAPAQVLSLIVSDVIGDDLDVIASGPTVPDSSTFGDCLEIVERYGIRSSLPGSVLHHLEAGAAGRVPETPKRGDPCFRNVRNVIVAGNRAAVEAGAEAAADLG